MIFFVISSFSSLPSPSIQARLDAANKSEHGEGSSSLTQFRCRGQPQQHSLVPHNSSQVSLPHNGSQVVSPRSQDSQSPPRLPPVHLTYNLLESMIQNVVKQNIAGNITGNITDR